MAGGRVVDEVELLWVVDHESHVFQRGFAGGPGFDRVDVDVGVGDHDVAVAVFREPHGFGEGEAQDPFEAGGFQGGVEGFADAEGLACDADGRGR